MNDKSELLERLRIERPAAEDGGGVSWIVWAIAIFAAVGVAGGILWYAVPRAIPISVATADLAPADVVVGPSTILDASGYVVARRQATVSAKITGKVVEVAIEEGQRVERGQVIARLDDTTQRAAAAQARAQRAQAEANLTAARVALDNAGPTFKRNEQQLAREVISAQTFDTAKAAYDAARTSLDVAARSVGVADAESPSRNATRTPISGSTRESADSSPIRTLTVAFARSAVGMIAITCAGISQSG